MCHKHGFDSKEFISSVILYMRLKYGVTRFVFVVSNGFSEPNEVCLDGDDFGVEEE